MSSYVMVTNVKIIFGVIFITGNLATCNQQKRTGKDSITNETLNINYSGNFLPKNSNRHRRFLTFNNDASHVRVEMVFAIPFLSIPVGHKRTDMTDDHQHHHGALVTPPKLDVNLKSLMAMSGILITLFLIVPKLVRLYFPNEPDTYRRTDETTNKFQLILEQINEVLEHYNIDIESCSQKAVCWIFNDAASKVQSGNANGIEKIINGISSSFPLTHIFGSLWKWNVLEDAIKVSKSGIDSCEYFRQTCPLTKFGINRAIFKFLGKF